MDDFNYGKGLNWPAYAIYYVHLSMHSIVPRRLGMRLPYTCTSSYCMSSSHLLMLAPFSALFKELEIEYTTCSVGLALTLTLIRYSNGGPDRDADQSFIQNIGTVANSIPDDHSLGIVLKRFAFQSGLYLLYATSYAQLKGK